MIDKSEKFSWLVRVGYFSRAVLYVMLGLVALTAAGQVSEGTDGIFRAIEEFPGGTALLWVMVAGLLGYALFRLCSPLFDIENEGSDAHGLARRAGHFGSAIGHLLLAWSAYHFATAEGPTAGDGTQEAAAGVLSFPFGGMALALFGVAFFFAAFSQARKGLTGEFMKRISAGAPDVTKTLGTVGYCARAAVYAVIGWSLIRAGWFEQGTAEIRTLGDALAELAGNTVIFQLVAAGLLVFGVFSLILARYRIIPDLKTEDCLPAALS